MMKLKHLRILGCLAVLALLAVTGVDARNRKGDRFLRDGRALKYALPDSQHHEEPQQRRPDKETRLPRQLCHAPVPPRLTLGRRQYTQLLDPGKGRFSGVVEGGS